MHSSRQADVVANHEPEQHENRTNRRWFDERTERFITVNALLLGFSVSDEARFVASNNSICI